MSQHSPRISVNDRIEIIKLLQDIVQSFPTATFPKYMEVAIQGGPKHHLGEGSEARVEKAALLGVDTSPRIVALRILKPQHKPTEQFYTYRSLIDDKVRATCR